MGWATARILLVLAVAFTSFNCSSSPSGPDDPGGCEPNCPVIPQLVGDPGLPDTVNVESRISCRLDSPSISQPSNGYRIGINVRRPDIGGTLPARCTCDFAVCPDGIGFVGYTGGGGWVMLRRSDPWILLTYILEPRFGGTNVDEADYIIYARQQ